MPQLGINKMISVSDTKSGKQSCYRIRVYIYVHFVFSYFMILGLHTSPKYGFGTNWSQPGTAGLSGWKSDIHLNQCSYLIPQNLDLTRL